MKYLHKVIAGLVLCTGCITSCKDDNKTELPGGLLTDKEEIAIGPEGGLEKIAVLSDISWVAGASKPWIAVSPANGLGAAECQLTIDSTLENTARTAQIRFSSEQAGQKLITVTQFGFGKQILLNETDVEIENSARYEKRTFEMVVSTNINFKIGSVEYAFDGTQSDEEKAEYESERTGWLTQPRQDDLAVDLDRKARPRTVKANFRWEMNTAPFVRVAKIHLVPMDPANDQLVDDNGNPIEDVVLTVRQKPALKIEDNRAGDSLAVITINEKVQSMIKFETSENMQNWENVTLWEATDKDLPCEEAVGRIRSVNFVMIDMKEGESLPKEVRLPEIFGVVLHPQQRQLTNPRHSLGRGNLRVEASERVGSLFVRYHLSAGKLRQIGRRHERRLCRTESTESVGNQLCYSVDYYESGQQREFPVLDFARTEWFASYRLTLRPDTGTRR